MGLQWVNDPNMGLKWPKKWSQGHFGPFWAHFGRFWGFFRQFGALLGLLDVILDQYAAAGPATRIIVPPNVEILAFLVSFRAILQYFGQILPLGALLGPFGPFLGPFGAFWALFRPF